MIEVVVSKIAMVNVLPLKCKQVRDTQADYLVAANEKN
jgi:hypothetical protein